MADTLTGTYSDATDLLSQFRSYIVGTGGWTENLYDDEGAGKRLHIQKTIGSDTFYFNFRSIISEVVPPSTKSFYAVVCNGSTGFDSGSTPMSQPGASSGGGAIKPYSSGSNFFRFVSDDNSFSITILSAYGSYEHIIGGCSSNMFGFFCTDMWYGVSQQGGYRRTLLRSTTNAYLYNCQVYYAGGWRCLYSWRDYSPYGYTNRLKPIFEFDSEGEKGLVVPSLLNASPNTNTGMPILFPFALFVGSKGQGVTEFRQFDGVGGVKVLNKKFIENNGTIAVGGDTYVVYQANYDQADYGLAFKISA